MASILEQTRMNVVQCSCWCDKESLRCAVSRGYAEKLAGMSRQSGANLSYLPSTLPVPRHIQGNGNFADFLTKVLGRARLLYLIKRFFGLEQ